MPAPIGTVPANTDAAEQDSGTSIKEFETTFASNNGYSGNLFTIEAKNDMVVEAFDINAGSTEAGLELRIYTKYGDFSRDDLNPGSTWTQISSTTVDGQGESMPTHVPSEAIRSVAIRAGERQSFYITFTDSHMKYTSALLDPNYLSNDDVSLVASAGTQYPFKHYFANRIWNGVIYYKLDGGTTADFQGSDTSVDTTSGAGQESQWNYATVGAVEARPPR